MGKEERDILRESTGIAKKSVGFLESIKWGQKIVELVVLERVTWREAID